ncbi:glycosyl hydrolase family 8 [Cytophaga aurantiaca]|uniref:glycosyl hydrolase family 8 n=1 Tax=Cytophaga aurantiaca TaxID=29530 RepID=UPI00036C1734|nr:glycosyl hydrolase family 8 [Cytophaga aurantiaca]
MIKKFNLKLIVFLIAWMSSIVLSAQINSSTAVVPFGANPNYGTNGIMPTNLPSGGAYGKSQDAADAYIEWRNAYTEACSGGMYRIKFDEPNRTVSEGIGYGMQLAAYAADKVLFDGLYTYWKNFKSPNSSGKSGKLMNWRIEGCGPTVSGTGSAADADVDAAWALLIAENQWPTATSPFDYASEATNMLFSIRELELNSSGQLINGDGWGFADNCRNPSYQSPAYYPFFATNNVTYAGAWNSAVNSAYSLITANADGTTGLISDWSNPSGNRNTCNPGGLGYAATDGYGYDACRNPWRMAQDVIWNNSAAGKTQCGKIATYLSGRGSAGNVGGPLYQTGGNYSGYAHNATFVATFATAVMGSSNQTLMNSMYTETKNTKDVIKQSTLSGYFGNTLRCVALFMMSGNYWKPGTTSIQEINVRQATNNVLTGTTFDFQNQQIAPPGTGKPITFTIENLGFTTLNLTGTTKVALSGTDATQFSVAQPSANSLTLGATTTFVVTFNPTTTGTKNAILTIASNDPDENPYTINITGIGTLNATAAKMKVYDTINVLSSGSTFAMGAFTTSSVGYKTLKITNTGDAPLTISAASFSGTTPPFSLLGTAPILPKTIAIGATGYLTVGYNAPATVTNSSSTMTLTTTDGTSPTFTLLLTANSIACSSSPSNNILNDYDGNVNVKIAFAPHGAFSPIAVNPSVGGLDLSPTVASYVRPSAGTTTPTVWDGKYDIIRYYNCGTVAGATHAASTYVAFNMTTAAPTVQILFYSPAVGVPITLSPQKPDLTTTSGWLPINADYSSNISVTTTKANQWELLTFDLSKIISPTNLTANIKCFDIQIDPLMAYSSLPANSAVSARTFYIDEIKYGINPCINDLSGVLQDFDAHTNTTLDYAVAALSAPVANPVSGGINTSPNVGQFTKTINAATYDDGFRYDGCGNKIDLSTKKYISMLVYSPVANASIQMSAKVPDGAADIDTYPDDAASSTQLTVFANKWHRLYFDLSAVSAANLPNVFGIDIFFDPNDLSAVSSPNNKFYFDDIRLETALPCVAGIPATDILNDFEDNRYLGVVFPGAAAFNTIKANPAPTGINTSAIVGEFTRGTLTAGTSVRFSACQGKLDLAPGHNLIDLKIYSPNAKVAVVMSLKNAAGVSLSDVTDTIQLANTWTNLRFDHTNIMNSTAVAFIDIIVDPNAVYSGGSSTAAARTYEFDDLKYAAPAPEINVKALTSPSTDIPSTGAFNMGTAAIGDSTTTLTFSIQNNGLQTLNLTGTPVLKLGGANAADFVVTTTQTFSTTVGSLGATGFSVYFKPTGTVTGARSASLTILNNDSNEGSYVIYLNGTATSAIIKVLDGGLTSSPIIASNNTTPINVGTSSVGVAATAYTMSIKNTGTAPLKITSITPSAGFTVTALSPASPIAPSAFSTFTVTGTPAATGVNAGTITVVSSDPATPSYVVNITVTGSVPVISVLDAAAAAVANNNTTAISVGSGPVGSAATPAYTFTINNTGSAPLTISSIIGTSGFSASALNPAGPIAVAGSATFTVTGTPAAAGVNTGSVTIASNDPATPSYKVNITVTGTVPALQVLNTTTVLVNNATPAISVGTATVATAATAYTSFSIKNTGAAPLTLTSITGSTGFAVTAITPTAPGTIAAGGTATFTVTGTPAAVGANTGTITIVTNDPTTPSFKINVSVTGTAAATPALQVLNTTAILTNNATPAISVGSSVVATAATAYTSFSIKNAGTAALTFTSITGSTGFAISAVTPAAPTTIAAGASATFTVTGTPAAVGANTGTITIVTNDPTTPSFVINVSVTGTSAPLPALQVLNSATVLVNNATPAISVGSSVVATAATAYTSFSIKNNGAAALTFTSITGSTGFAISAVTPAAPTTIAAGASATFTVTGTPAAVGANTGTITIVTNDPTTPSFVINVSVTGTSAPLPALQVLNTTTVLVNNATPAISVGTAGITTPATAYTSFSVKNNGTAALSLTSITGSTGFAISAITPTAPASIAAGASATFTVTGTPAVAGANAGTITIVTNDPTTPSFVINVSVTGTVAPQLQVLNAATVLANNATPATSVGSSAVGSAATAYTSFSIKNAGTAALTFTSVTGSAGFAVSAVTPTTPGSIAAGGTATFTVTGTPAALGANAGTITIVTNDPTTPSFVINVAVTGIAASTPAVQVLNTTAILTNNATPAISVGSALTGTAATDYTSFSVKNVGTAALTFTSVTGSTGFAISAITPTTPGSIAVGATATFTVTGTPAVNGVNTGTITIVTNDPTTPSFVINVSVTGTVPALQVLNAAATVTNNNTPAISVGTATVATAATAYTSFSVKNTGTAPLTLTSITGSTGFAVSAITPATPATIAPNGTATFTVTGTPAAIGANTGTLTIATNDPTTPSFVVNVSVTGTAAPTPTVQVLNSGTPVTANNATAISVGSAVAGSAATAYTSFSIKNTGLAALTLTSITGSTGFAISAVTPTTPATIAANGTATFTVTGTPAALGANTGTITIVTNDPTTPSFVVNVTVTGTTPPAPALKVLNSGANVANNNTPAISVGSAVVATAGTAYTSLSIKNTGNAPLTLTSITGSAGFAISAISPAAPATIAANGTATFTVKGTPSVVGANTGTITIVTNDPTTPSFVVNVSVTGTTAPQATVSVPGATNNGPAVSIGSAVVGNPTSPYTFTITNTGTLPLNVANITSTNPDFIVTQVSPTTIAPGASGTFTVTAKPSAVGTSTGQIVIPSNDPGGDFKINVTATGTGAPAGPAIQLKNYDGVIVANNGSLVIGSALINTPTQPHIYTITNIGGADLIITNIVATSGFSATKPKPLTVSAGQSVTFTITGTPTNASATTWGTITILTTNNTDGTFTFNAGVNVGTPTALRSLSSTDISMFPNPTALGYSNIEFNGAYDEVVVTVYSADGSRAIIKNFSSVVEATRQLDIQELPSGVYFVEVATAQGMIVQRLIKQ